jgi:L-ribulose-5-phosphate 3-epimerase UlaE
MCEQVEGFDYLALSEPTPAKKFHRLGWINFKEGTDIKAAFDKLDNQKVTIGSVCVSERTWY